MIGSCDCCDRQHVPVSRFNATGAYPEGVACFICRGETDLDPYGELFDEAMAAIDEALAASPLSSQERA